MRDKVYFANHIIVTTTSGHHGLQELQDIVQVKVNYIAELQKNEEIMTTLQSTQQSKCIYVCMYVYRVNGYKDDLWMNDRCIDILMDECCYCINSIISLYYSHYRY